MLTVAKHIRENPNYLITYSCKKRWRVCLQLDHISPWKGKDSLTMHFWLRYLQFSSKWTTSAVTLQLTPTIHCLPTQSQSATPFDLYIGNYVLAHECFPSEKPAQTCYLRLMDESGPFLLDNEPHDIYKTIRISPLIRWPQKKLKTNLSENRPITFHWINIRRF